MGLFGNIGGSSGTPSRSKRGSKKTKKGGKGGKNKKEGNKRQERENIFAQKLDLDEDFRPPFFPKNEENYLFIDAALGSNFVFANLTSKERRGVIDAMMLTTVNANTNIVTQGEQGDNFYVVDDGTVHFEVSGKKVGQCSRGGSFGELALLYNCPRSASCIAETACRLWVVDQKTFRFMLAKTSKFQNQETFGILKKVSFFADLEPRDLNRIAEAFTTKNYPAGERIITKGEIGENFFIIQEGKVRVHDIGQRNIEATMGEGDFFGERALLTGEPRNASVTATTDAVLLCLGREEFQSVLGPLQAAIDRAQSKRTLLAIPIFIQSEFQPLELNLLADLMVEYTFQPGTVLTERGKRFVHNFYIIRQGKVRIRHGGGREVFLGDSDYFGSQFLKEPDEELAAQTITVLEETRCGVLAKPDFAKVVGDVNRLGKPEYQMRRKKDDPMELKELHKVRILGVGMFGKVWLTKHKHSDKVYALKMLSKHDVIRLKQVGSVMSEKKILSTLDHPFIINMIHHMQDKKNLYMVLELVQGGELFSVIHTDDHDGIPNGHARFYAICILEALFHMHMRQIAYRDLKPENVLIDAKGYCVLVDLGLAKIVEDKTYTLCGTPEYLAPEVIMSKGHDRAADYWSFGVLVYEMIVGNSPFYVPGNMGQVALFQRICKAEYSFPPGVIDPRAQDLIARLLVRKQANRFGCLARGIMDIRDHPWFQIVDIEMLWRRRWPAPWVPELESNLDASHFESYEHIEKSRKKDPPISSEDQEIFQEF